MTAFGLTGAGEEIRTLDPHLGKKDDALRQSFSSQIVAPQADEERYKNGHNDKECRNITSIVDVVKCVDNCAELPEHIQLAIRALLATIPTQTDPTTAREPENGS